MISSRNIGLLSAILAAAAVSAQTASNSVASATSETSAIPEITAPATLPAEAKLTDGEVWNKGVDAYREALELPAGSSNRVAAAEKALALLRPLMLSKTHGARASEVVGALQHERMKATAAQDPATAAAAAEYAAAAMQIALRAAPEDARANRNFTRAVDRVAELREEAHVKSLLAKGTPDLGSAVTSVRSLLQESKGVLTNEASRALELSEAMSKRATQLADELILLQGKLVEEIKQNEQTRQNPTNLQQLTYAINEVKAAREATKRAADQLADLNPDAHTSLAQTEDVFTRFWKVMAEPREAVNEAIVAQTNAFLDVEKLNNRPWQQEALDFTHTLQNNLPEWAEKYKQQAQADTNAPPFTEEDQKKIMALAHEVEQIQQSNLKSEDPPSMLEALKKLGQIHKLLPGPGDNKNPPQQNNQQQNQQNQNKDQNQDQNKDDKKDQQQDQNKDQQQPPPEPNEDEKKEQQAEEKKDQPPPKDDEVEALLQKAQDRNDQHENEKKARMRKAPLSPNERDW